MSNIYYRMIMGFLCLVFVGCAATPPARFYLLTPMPGVMAPQCNDPTSQATVVGVEPVVLADYLNRPQIMTRVDPNQIMPLEFHRWAGSLERDFSRVLIDNLGLLLATDQIVVYPSNAMVRHYWRVAVQVLRFDGIIDQQATLEARWTIIDQKKQTTVASCKMTVTEPVKGKSYRNLVMAMSRTITQLSTRIASEIRQHTNSL